MQNQEQDQLAEPLGHQEHPQIPTRRRGRKPPRPTTPALNDTGAGDGGGEDQAQGWQLHYSSTGHPFYFNRVTGESAWARTVAGNSRSTMLGDNHDSNNTSSSLRHNSYKPMLGSRNTSSGSGSRISSGGSSSSGTSLTSSSSLAAMPFSRDYSTTDSSETVSTSSASYASTGSNPTSSSGDTDGRSWSSSSESSETTSTSSESSWTGSLEARFRQMITSERGRKLLAEEVEALTARQARHSQRQSARGTIATRRFSRRRRKKNVSMPTATLEGLHGENGDVEMALLATETSESGGSSSGSSSGSSDSSTESSFSLHLSSGSDGGSDLSLLTSDVVLERLEKVEKVLVVARSAAVSVLFASYMFTRRASIFVWAMVWRGAIRAQRGLFSGRSRSRSSSFSPATI